MTGDPANASMRVVGTKFGLGKTTATFSVEISTAERYFHQLPIPPKAERQKRKLPYSSEAPEEFTRHESFRRSLDKLSTSKVCIQVGWPNVEAHLQQHQGDITAVIIFSISTHRLFAGTSYVPWRC